ncbi:hypothetical protein A3Q56_01039 [Intoshia linei]|uniref:Tyrosine specific protein phosphatases domain-containing protein n=1 Tax=Intoshia linei TaxID=1819745 RepID=A0A177BCC4_9BILA|nr:hypothetical protein A3Q56_01039 [Intoshia linei]
MNQICIEYRNLRFIVTSAPHDVFMNNYINMLKSHQVTDLIRVCDVNYSVETEMWRNANINIEDWPFTDGDGPPVDIVKKFLLLVKNRLKNNPGSCIAVHCVYGLGRSVALVAIALIEFGLNSKQAVEYIRK